MEAKRIEIRKLPSSTKGFRFEWNDTTIYVIGAGQDAEHEIEKLDRQAKALEK